MQIGQASFIYANENGGWILRDGLRQSPTQPVVHDPWFLMIDRLAADVEPREIKAVQQLSQNRLFKCPSHPHPTQPAHYVVNAFAQLKLDYFNVWEFAGPTKLSQIRNASDVVFVIDGADRSAERWGPPESLGDDDWKHWFNTLDVWSVEMLPGGVRAARVAASRHGKGRVNALFFDGSVRSVEPMKLTARDFYDGITNRRDRIVIRGG